MSIHHSHLFVCSLACLAHKTKVMFAYKTIHTSVDSPFGIVIVIVFVVGVADNYRERKTIQIYGYEIVR